MLLGGGGSRRICCSKASVRRAAELQTVSFNRLYDESIENRIRLGAFANSKGDLEAIFLELAEPLLLSQSLSHGAPNGLQFTGADRDAMMSGTRSTVKQRSASGATVSWATLSFCAGPHARQTV